MTARARQHLLRGWRSLWIVALGATAVAAEEVTVSTYYPEAHGVYEELETAGPTELAVWGGKVGIGLGNPRGGVDVAANAAVSQAITIGNVVISGGATWRLEDKGGRFALSATQDLSGGTPLETLTATRPNGYVGIGNFGTGGLPKDHLDVKGGAVIGESYVGEAQAGSGDLMVEGRTGLGLSIGQLPQNKLDVVGEMVIGNSLAGTKDVGPDNSAAVQTRMAIGTATVSSPTRLAVAGPVVIGDSLTGALAPGGADLTASGTIVTASKFMVVEDAGGAPTGTSRVEYGALSGGRFGGEVRGAGTAAGAESAGGTERLFVDGTSGRIFEASTVAPGRITVLNTLNIDTTAKSVTIPSGATLQISPAPAAGDITDFVFVSDGSGKGTWTDPLTLDTNGDGKPDLKGAPGSNVNQNTTSAVIGLDARYVDAVGGPVCNPSDLTHYFKGGGCGSCGGAVVATLEDVIDESGSFGPASVDCFDHPSYPIGADNSAADSNDAPISVCTVELRACTGW